MPQAAAITQGDFTQLADAYVNRPGYCHRVLEVLAHHVGTANKELRIADIGAGTGKLSEDFVKLGFSTKAIEPNDEMRRVGMDATQGLPVRWSKGSGEETGLPNNSADWILMASSFHWVDLERALNEFFRVLSPGGYFTAIWNPRDIFRSELHTRIEERIFDLVPNLRRKSSGSKQYTQDLPQRLRSTGQFDDVLFIESEYDIEIPRERYLGAWRSVNDIQAQAGQDGFERVMLAIETELGDAPIVQVPYKTRAWTVRRQ